MVKAMFFFGETVWEQARCLPLSWNLIGLNTWKRIKKVNVICQTALYSQNSMSHPSLHGHETFHITKIKKSRKLAIAGYYNRLVFGYKMPEIKSAKIWCISSSHNYREHWQQNLYLGRQIKQYVISQ